MATVVTRQLTSHLAISSRSAVNVGKTLTGFSSRSDARRRRFPAHQCRCLPHSAAERGCHPASSPFFCPGSFRAVPVASSEWTRYCLSAQAAARLRKNESTLLIGISLNTAQTVTTVWSTEPGARLILGFDTPLFCRPTSVPVHLTVCTAGALSRKVPAMYGPAKSGPLAYPGSRSLGRTQRVDVERAV